VHNHRDVHHRHEMIQNEDGKMVKQVSIRHLMIDLPKVKGDAIVMIDEGQWGQIPGYRALGDELELVRLRAQN